MKFSLAAPAPLGGEGATTVSRDLAERPCARSSHLPSQTAFAVGAVQIGGALRCAFFFGPRSSGFAPAHVGRRPATCRWAVRKERAGREGEIG